MNELDTILASGLIEAYCLGSLSAKESAEVKAMADLYPEVQAAIVAQLSILEKYAVGPIPRAELKTQVLDFLDRHWESEPIDVINPPLIHTYSDHQAWSTAIKQLEPEMEDQEYAIRVLKDTQEHSLSLVWLTGSMVENKHDAEDFQESFFILEGECECNFEGTIVRFGAGDYFEIPPNTAHTIKNISLELGYVKGLVQRLKAA